MVALWLLAWPLVALVVLGPAVSFDWLLGPVAVAAVFWIAAHLAVTRRSRREIIAADYHRCLECRYPLAALPPQGRCPECGAAYEHDQVRACWLWTLNQ